jgi:hypothetical protein
MPAHRLALMWPDVRVEHVADAPGHLVIIAGHGTALSGEARITLDAIDAAKIADTLARMAQEAERRRAAHKEASRA